MGYKKLQCKSSSNYEKAKQAAVTMIDQNQPILVYVDMPYLSYLGLNKNSHFGGHAVVLFGYDNETEQFWISDRDNHDYPIRTPFGKIADYLWQLSLNGDILLLHVMSDEIMSIYQKETTLYRALQKNI